MRNNIEGSLATSMQERIVTLAYVPVLVCFLFVVAAVVREETSWTDSASIQIAFMLIVFGLFGLWISKSQLPWRGKLAVYVVPLVPASLLAYYGVGSHAAALVALYTAIALLAQSAVNRHYWKIIVGLSGIVIAISIMHTSDPAPGIKPTQLLNFWLNPQQYLFIGFCYGVGLIVTLICYGPLWQTLQTFQQNQKKEETELIGKSVIASSAQTTLLNSLPEFVVELDEFDSIATLSSDAQQQLNLSQETLNTHYANSPLATLATLPELIHVARRTGASYSANTQTSVFSPKYKNLTVTPYNNSATAKIHLLLTMSTTSAETKTETNSLLAQQLKQFLALVSEAGCAVCFISYRLTDTADNMSADHPRMARIIEESLPTHSQFLDTQLDRGAVIVTHRQSPAQQHMLQQIQALQAETNNLLIGVKRAKLNNVLPETFLVSCIGTHDFISNTTSTGYFDETEANMPSWNAMDRIELQRDIDNDLIDLFLTNTERTKPDLSPIKELKFLRTDTPIELQKSEDLLKRLMTYKVATQVLQKHGKKIAVTLESTLNTENNTLINVRVPDTIFTGPERLLEFQATMMALDIPANRVYLRINESDASMLTAVQWDYLTELGRHGFKFALGEIGVGHTDITLMANPIFSMLHFARETTSQAATVDRADRVFRTAVSIAQDLGCQTMAKADNTLDVLNYLRRLGVDYIDTV